MDLKPSDVTRFWEKVRKGPGCWEWQAATRPKSNGYGAFKLNGRVEDSHRVAWTLEYGQIPDGFLVCHHCDNKPCVNHLHLFVGTYRQNSLDAVYKGLIIPPPPPNRHGEDFHNAKLTEDDVNMIRSRYTMGNVTYRKLAREYDVDHSLIYQIVKGRGWSHLLKGREGFDGR